MPALIFSKPLRVTLAVMVRRLVEERPENFQSSFVSLAPKTLTKEKGFGAIPSTTSRDEFASKTKTMSHRVNDSLGGMFFALKGRKQDSPGQRPGKQERHNDPCPVRAKQNV